MKPLKPSSLWYTPYTVFFFLLFVFVVVLLIAPGRGAS